MEATLGVRFGSVEYSNRVPADVPLGLIVAVTAAEVGPTEAVTPALTVGRDSVVNEPDGPTTVPPVEFVAMAR